MPPSTPKRKKQYLTRDQRLQILTLRDAGFIYDAISRQLHVTYEQVEYTCYIFDRYGGVQLSYPRLRAAVLEAWEAIPVEKLEELIQGMQDRCQAVIDAHGMHIKA
jgi:hypothetical protein